ncbi:MAG: type II secretion system minor pseudopilin GspK [Pseudomonadota bacterium]
MAARPSAGDAEARGVALLSVMLMLALLATLLIYTADIEDMNIRRLSNIRQAEQGFQVTMGGEQWGIKILEKDLVLDIQAGNEAFDHPSEDWGNLGGAVDVEGTETVMLVSVEDAQGRINLNNLIQPYLTESQRSQVEQQLAELRANPDGVDEIAVSDLEDQLQQIYWYTVFRNLLVNLELEPELADVVADWVDSDSNTRGTTGAEDLYYQGLEEPYRAANRQFQSTAELSLLKDFTPEVIQSLAPYVTAIPVSGPRNLTRLNVNTAPAQVLAAMVAANPRLAEVLNPLLESRAVQPYSVLTNFINALGSQLGASLPAQLVRLLDTRSDYYFTYVCAETDKVKLSQRSLMFKNRAQENVKVLSRERYFGCPGLQAGTADAESDEEDSNDAAESGES